MRTRIFVLTFTQLFFLSGFAQPGSLDMYFNTSLALNPLVFSTAVQPDGKVIVCGSFTNFIATPVPHIARINTNGTLDTSFDPGTGPNDQVYTVALQPDGKIVIGGAFTSYNGVTRNRIARLNSDGSLDPTFSSDLNNWVTSVEFQPDGKILTTGFFTTCNGITRNRIARLTTSGLLDFTFIPGTGANSYTTDCALQADGKIILTGDFTSYNGTARNRVVRINADGSLDASYNPGTGLNTVSWSCQVQSDGKILLAGEFTTFNGISKNRLVRTNANGTLDVSYNSGIAANDQIRTISLQSDGKLIIGGGFTSFDGVSRTRIARVNLDGSLDSSFDPGSGFSGFVYTTAIQADGKIVVGGTFNSYNSIFRGCIAKIHGLCDVPVQPSSISGVINSCNGTSNVYSVINDLESTSYNWSLPSGWVGSSVNNSITVTTGATNGTISVTAANVCGTSLAQELVVTSTSIPNQPTSISGNDSLCGISSQIYSVLNDPNAASYTWTIPGAWIGTSNTNSINLTNGASGTILVSASNACGNSVSQSLVVSVLNIPTQPLSISGPSLVCLSSSESYSVPSVSGASTYSWSFPGDWSGASTSNNIALNIGGLSGNVSVTANNICGNSTAQILAVDVISAPLQPILIQGDDSVCENSSTNYFVTDDPNADFYFWDLPGTWIGSSDSSSVETSILDIGGTILVSATNMCGTSIPQSLVVVVNELPTVTFTLPDDVLCFNDASMVLEGGLPLGGVYSGNGVSAGVFDGSLAGFGAHNLTYVYTDANGCSADEVAQVTVSGCSGIESNGEFINVNVFPNPFNSSISIILPNFSETTNLTVLNTAGQIVLQVTLSDKISEIEMEGVAPGVYFLVLANSDEYKVLKVEKQ